MLLVSFLAVIMPSAPTLAEVLQLPPANAGEVILEGKNHKTIKSVVQTTARYSQPPGWIQLELIEEARRIAGGCSRKRWIATFQHHENEIPDEAVLVRTYGRVEIAPTASQDCSKSSYVGLNSGVDLDDGFAALMKLEDIRSGAAQVAFSCSDLTGSQLCKDTETTRLELAAIEPWMVSFHEGSFELWLGEPGQIVTKVRLGSSSADPVTVARLVPPPS